MYLLGLGEPEERAGLLWSAGFPIPEPHKDHGPPPEPSDGSPIRSHSVSARASYNSGSSQAPGSMFQPFPQLARVAPRTFWGSDDSMWGLSCVLQDGQQRAWPLSTPARYSDPSVPHPHPPGGTIAPHWGPGLHGDLCGCQSLSRTEHASRAGSPQPHPQPGAGKAECELQPHLLWILARFSPQHSPSLPCSGPPWPRTLKASLCPPASPSSGVQVARVEGTKSFECHSLLWPFQTRAPHRSGTWGSQPLTRPWWGLLLKSLHRRPSRPGPPGTGCLRGQGHQK